MASVADILGKKSSFQAIRQRLSHAWDETFSNIETESTDCIEAGDFLIDMAARSATVCGQELHLSRAELDVLVFLISHRKQVVTPHTMLATKFEGAGAVRGGPCRRCYRSGKSYESMFPVLNTFEPRPGCFTTSILPHRQR